MKLTSMFAVWMAFLFSAASFAQQDSLKYRISLTDKSQTPYSLDEPERFLSPKAIERRKHQGLPVDSTDLPVSPVYIEAIRSYGLPIVVTGKWDNFVTVSCNDTTIMDQISSLPFVREVKRVWNAPEKGPDPVERDSVANVYETGENYYGDAWRQIEISNGHLLHQAGFSGHGMMVGVIDAGFHNADRIALLENVKIEGVRDFVDSQSDIYGENDHGMKVLSCMAANIPYAMVGTAPDAGYVLLRGEDAYTEHLVEQDYWAAALEYADSLGVDVVNTSLGYYDFDDKTQNYRYRDLDGHFSLMSRQAGRAADKGMIVVCSAGNAGSGPWKKITPPADADHILTVGAIGRDGVLANFSSVGNTADGRVKPDVVAVGNRSTVIDTDGTLSSANGTSFASPILCGMVTCLWQACPELTAREIIEIVRLSGDRAEWPDNIYGYGVPDMWKAYQLGKQRTEEKR